MCHVGPNLLREFVWKWSGSQRPAQMPRSTSTGRRYRSQCFLQSSIGRRRVSKFAVSTQRAHCVLDGLGRSWRDGQVPRQAWPAPPQGAGRPDCWETAPQNARTHQAQQAASVSTSAGATPSAPPSVTIVSRPRVAASASCCAALRKGHPARLPRCRRIAAQRRRRLRCPRPGTSWMQAMLQRPPTSQANVVRRATGGSTRCGYPARFVASCPFDGHRVVVFSSSPW